MEHFGKIFPMMYEGSMYGAGLHVFAVWPWALAHKDENGLVEINPVFVAPQLGCSRQEVQTAIEYLMRPDPNSRSKDNDGRRLVKVSQFGYQVVNHEHYSRLGGGDRRQYWQQWRAKRSATVAQRSASSAQRRATHIDTDTHADTEKERAALSLSEAIRLADLLESLIRQRKPDFKRGGNWAKDIDLMIRLDKRQSGDVEAVIRWAQADGFWCNNILSGATLRRQYDRLDLKRRQVQPANEDSQARIDRMKQKGLL